MKTSRTRFRQTLVGIILMVLMCGLSAGPASAGVVFSDSFESGWGNWYTDNGIWNIGMPSSGPGSCFDGDSNCMATVLEGKYPYGPDSRLISPRIDLPNVNNDEELLLRFREHFSYSSSDRGEVQISTYNTSTNEWSGWTSIRTVSSYIPKWHHIRVDLTAYAGMRVRLGFFHVDSTEKDPYGRNIHSESTGWYIDDLEVFTQTIPVFSAPVLEDFESDWGGWYSGNGIWELGEATSGPGSCYGGEGSCMTTILNGKYPYGPDSRLISPRMKMPSVNNDEELLLRFREYFSYSSSDRGEVQISTYDDNTNTWSEWTSVRTVSSYIPKWHHIRVDLTAYAGLTIRLGFIQVDSTEKDPYGRNIHSESTGWYIDDLEVFTQTIPVFSAPVLEDFESDWGGWYSSNGIWELGEAASGPGSCYGGEGNCMATILDGNYPYGPDSRLISPQMELPSVNNGEELLLRFREHFSYSSSDRGYVQISTYESDTNTWSGWTTVKTVTSYIPKWNHARVDITAYAGMKVRLGFYHVDSTEKDPYGRNIHSESSGWYIDDLEVFTQTIPLLPIPGLENFESGWGGWYTSNDIWELAESANCYGGSGNCMVTILNGKYPYGPNSRLISPEMELPVVNSGDELLLRFQDYFSYSSADRGYVQIRTYDSDTDTWSDWTTIKTMSSYIPDWHHARIDITAYAGMRVRLGFYHVDSTEKDPYGRNIHSESSGWYIDNLEITGTALPQNYYCDNDNDGHFSSASNGTCDGSNCPSACQLTPGGDCNDADNTVYPGASEICDNRDNNCNSVIDEDLTRQTTCGVGQCEGNAGEETCVAGVWSNNTCDPFARATDEVCDEIDNNCNGLIDDGAGTTYYQDSDGDGYGNPEVIITACTVCLGTGCPTQDGNDCNDNDNTVHPDADDSTCNGVDNDCNGQIDDKFVSYTTNCGVGVCSSTGLVECIDGSEIDSCVPKQPTESPEATCDDNLDNDCNGVVDDCTACTDTDGDGISTDGGNCGPVDNCPDTANPTQTDSDNDGVGDICDDEPRILIDSSRDGGIWWSPQVHPFDPSKNHQGKALADYLKSLGYGVTELPRPTSIRSDFLELFDLVIRANGSSYANEEITAYETYISDGGRLLLLADHMANSPTDSLASSFGITFEGISRGENLMDRFIEHPVTAGLMPLNYGVGSGITELPASAEIIGYLSSGTYLDLNDNEQQDPDEPSGSAALGTMRHGRGKIVFSGETNLWQSVPQPLVENTINWLVNDDQIVTGVRTLPSCQASGSEIEVTLEIDLLEGKEPNGLVINEIIPDGWEVMSASHMPTNCVPGDLTSPCNGELNWVLFGGGVKDTTITYTVSVPDSDPNGSIKSFAGELIFNDQNGDPVNTQIAGDMDTRVGCPYHPYDANQNWKIDVEELLDAIDDWVENIIGDFELLDIIDIWAYGSYCWDNFVELFKGGIPGDAGICREI